MNKTLGEIGLAAGAFVSGFAAIEAVSRLAFLFAKIRVFFPQATFVENLLGSFLIGVPLILVLGIVKERKRQITFAVSITVAITLLTLLFMRFAVGELPVDVVITVVPWFLTIATATFVCHHFVQRWSKIRQRARSR
jgi:hypothetical protein